jgi:hypothetical protein
LYGDPSKCLGIDVLNKFIITALGYQLKVITVDEFNKQDPELKDKVLLSILNEA